MAWHGQHTRSGSNNFYYYFRFFLYSIGCVHFLSITHWLLLFTLSILSALVFETILFTLFQLHAFVCTTTPQHKINPNGFCSIYWSCINIQDLWAQSPANKRRRKNEWKQRNFFLSIVHTHFQMYTSLCGCFMLMCLCTYHRHTCFIDSYTWKTAQ